MSVESEKQLTPPESKKATAVFVLGILGIVTCGICGIIALVMGYQERKKVVTGEVAGSGMLTTGWIMGIIGSCILGAQLLATLLWLGFFLVAVVAGLAAS